MMDGRTLPEVVWDCEIYFSLVTIMKPFETVIQYKCITKGPNLCERTSQFSCRCFLNIKNM